jgi:hypothetical protein
MEGEDSPESQFRTAQDDADGAGAPAGGDEAEDRQPRRGARIRHPCRPSSARAVPFNEVKAVEALYRHRGAGALMNFMLGYLVLLGVLVSHAGARIITLKIYGLRRKRAKCASRPACRLEDEILAVNGRTLLCGRGHRPMS